MGTTLTIAPGGELDIATTPDVERDVIEAATAVDRLVLDLSRLDFMDTAGVHMLLRLRERFGRERLELRHPVGAARRVVDVAEVADLVGFADR